jgi:quinol monooxygenase YgiN
MVTAVTKFRADPARIEDLTLLLRDLRLQLQHTLGCQGARLFQETDDPTAFTLVECWESEEPHRDNLSDLIESDIWSSIAKLLSEEPEHRYYAELV